MLDEAVLDKLLTLNPARYAKLERVRKYKAAVYDAEQVAEMLERLRDEEIYPVVLLAVSGALRRGEGLGATWQAADLDRGTLQVTQAYYVVDGVAGFDPVKSDDSEDVVYLPDFVVAELKRIKKQQMKMKLQLGAAWQDNDLICRRTDGSPWNPSTVSKKFSEALASHGLPHIRLHDLRHTHATVLHEAGTDMKDISNRLRHSTEQITADIYTDMTAKRKRKVADTFEKAVFGQKSSPVGPGGTRLETSGCKGLQIGTSFQQLPFAIPESLEWCREWGLDTHGPRSPRDFKSGLERDGWYPLVPFGAKKFCNTNTLRRGHISFCIWQYRIVFYFSVARQ